MTEKFTPKYIKFLTDANFMTFNQWVSSETNNVEAVFTSEFMTEVNLKSEELYVKLYPFNTKGLINEIIGWLLNKSLSIPHPDRAFLISLDLSKIPLTGASERIKIYLSKLKESSVKKVLCFATSSVLGESAGIKFMRGQEEYQTLIDDIKKWSNLHKAIMGDEKMANTDRHFNNLIRIAKSNYVLIDNGRLFNDSNNWGVEELKDPLVNLANKLSDFVLGKNVQYQDSSKIVHLAESANPEKSYLDEIFFWSDHLIHDEVERDCFKDFLIKRIENIETIVKKRYGLLS